MATYTSNTFSVTVSDAEGVTGPITPDGQVTIAWDDVNGFGATGPTVRLFDDFRGGSNNAAIPLTSPQVGDWSAINESAPTYSTEYARSGGSSLRFRNTTVYTKITDIALLQNFNFSFPATNEFFISYWMRTPDYWPGIDDGVTGVPILNTVHRGSNFKVVWISDDNFGNEGRGNDGGTDLCLPTKSQTEGDGSPIFQVAGNDGLIAYDGDAEGRICPQTAGWGNESGWLDPFNGWSRYTFWFKADAVDADVNSGDLYGQVVTPTLAAQKSFSSSGTPVFNASNVVNLLRFPGWAADDNGKNSADDCRPLFDDVYLATGSGAAARVEIGDNATYASCTDLALATVDSWSDTSVTCTLRSGAFTDFSGKYIHIHDADNNYVGSSRLIS